MSEGSAIFRRYQRRFNNRADRILAFGRFEPLVYAWSFSVQLAKFHSYEYVRKKLAESFTEGESNSRISAFVSLDIFFNGYQMLILEHVNDDYVKYEIEKGNLSGLWSQQAEPFYNKKPAIRLVMTPPKEYSCKKAAIAYLTIKKIGYTKDISWLIANWVYKMYMNDFRVIDDLIRKPHPERTLRRYILRNSKINGHRKG